MPENPAADLSPAGSPPDGFSAADFSAERARLLHAHAAGYSRLAVDNIAREFPSDIHHTMTEPGDFPYRPRERSPVFFGSFDWHSCVEMHWLLVRLLRTAAGAVPGPQIRQVLDRQFAPEALAAEARFMAQPDDALRQRPYGWGWALALIEETTRLDQDAGDADGRRWAAAMEPLGEALTSNFLTWLPKATYPIRYGMHSNGALGLSRALPYARRRAEGGDSRLADAITATARRWFAGDTDYPAGWEPSGHDFLSPALTEAELMTRVLPGAEFARWLGAFLPGIAGGEPAALFTPAIVSDSSDGWIAHLHGLNLSRACCWRRLAEALPADDPRVPAILAAVARHTDASLPHVVGDDYMVEHWLAAYAVLLLS
ncbi:MAG: DUF2891 domain-containing protein [Streptosporangiaceae bacterium]